MSSPHRAAGRWPERKPGTNPMGGLVSGERSLSPEYNSTFGPVFGGQVTIGLKSTRRRKWNHGIESG